MRKSILVPMIRAYLTQCRGFAESYHQSFVSSEAERIAERIYKTFGRGNFDESNQESCAAVIRAIMADPEYQSIKAGGFGNRIK